MKKLCIESYCELHCPRGYDYMEECDYSSSGSLKFKTNSKTVRKALMLSSNKAANLFVKNELTYDEGQIILQYCKDRELPINIKVDCCNPKK